MERGRIDHICPKQFIALVRRWPGCRVVFEACMNWHWLLEILEGAMPRENIMLANPFKTRIIAEAQIKTDKVDARILADLLRGNLVSRVYICGKATRREQRRPSPPKNLSSTGRANSPSAAMREITGFQERSSLSPIMGRPCRLAAERFPARIRKKWTSAERCGPASCPRNSFAEESMRHAWSWGGRREATRRFSSRRQQAREA